MSRFPALLLSACLVLAAPAAVAVADPATPPGPTGPTAPTGPPSPEGRADGDGVPQTSDGVPGEIARPLPPLGRVVKDTSVRARWTPAPGMRVTVWDELSSRGPVRAHLLAFDWRRKGVVVDYANAGPVARTARLTDLLARDRAVAGVNGDFFDIGDTGAPLGVGRDRERGLLNGRRSGWNSAFYLTAKGRPEIGELPVRTRIKQLPGVDVATVNSPEVPPGGIGVYRPSWGTTSGYRVTGGQTTKVRMVLVQRGRVVRNRTTLPSGTRIKGTLLVGRGDGARALSRLKRGARVTVTSRVLGAPRMAITGNKVLLRDGVVDVVDDRELHPRTAVGIDRDAGQLLFLVIDGRQATSRGYTMVELADLMVDLGADEALNLDGGGSSTLAARRQGRVRVVNSPSDGAQRAVPNGIQVTLRR